MRAPNRIILASLILTAFPANADPIPASGWNVDFVLGNGETHGAHAQPENANIWFAEDSTVGVPGLPASGALSSLGEDFQMEAFTGGANNVLRGPGTLTLDTPGKFSEITLLGSNTGGSGTATWEIILKFTDAADSAPITYTAFGNWAGSGPEINPTLTGNGTSSAFGGQLNTRSFDLDALGHSGKTLQSIEFLSTGGAGGNLALFALSGQSLNAVVVSPSDFISSAPQSAVVGTLGTPFGDGGDTFTYALVTGDGDTDNTKFQIGGAGTDELQIGAHDFTTAAEGEAFSVRVRSTGSPSGDMVEAAVIVRARADSDSDDLLDSYEETWAGLEMLGVLSGLGGANSDNDGLTDLEEYNLRDTYPTLDPTNPDSDGDNLNDGPELAGAGLRPPTDPTKADTDGDTLSDEVETNTKIFNGPTDTGSDPTLVNSDTDDFDDAVEVSRGGDPSDPNSVPPIVPVASYVYGANPESQPQATNWQGGSISDLVDFGGQFLEKLSDGVVATGGWRDFTHVGFRNDADNSAPQPRVTFDFGGLFDVTTVDVFSNTDFAALDSVDVSTSTDGATFTAPTTFPLTFEVVPGPNSQLTLATLDVSALPDATHYRLDFQQDSQWAMINEVEFTHAGPTAPFAITDIDYAPDAELKPTVTLTWRARAGTNYSAFASTDLADWSNELADNLSFADDEIPGDGDHITETFVLEFGLEKEGDLFFRIEEE